jgi:hypothetical protein
MVLRDDLGISETTLYRRPSADGPRCRSCAAIGVRTPWIGVCARPDVRNSSRANQGTFSTQGMPTSTAPSWLENGQGGRLLILLRHNHDPQRLNTSAAPSEVSGVDGRHRHRRLLLQASSTFRRSNPSWMTSINAMPSPGEARVAPSIPAPRHTVSNVAQTAPQPSYSVGQAGRRV